MKIMKRVIKMPPNVSGLVTVGDETPEPVLNVESSIGKLISRFVAAMCPPSPGW